LQNLIELHLSHPPGYVPDLNHPLLEAKFVNKNPLKKEEKKEPKWHEFGRIGLPVLWALL